MATYAYLIKHDKRLVKGTLQAPNHAQALAKAQKQEGVLLEIKEVKVHTSFLDRFSKSNLNLKERIIFTEQVAVMLQAGIPLPQSLRSLEEEAPRKGIKTLYGNLADELEEGMPFSQILQKYPQSFSPVYCSMVESAEKSGNLGEVLLKLTEQQRKEYELRGKVKGALMYPAVISILLVGVITMVITFVLPRLSSLFTETGTSLPLSTRMLLALSFFMVNYWYVVIGGIVAFIVTMRLIGNNPRGRYVLDSLKLRIPVIGTFIRKAIIARFAQTFSFLVQAGVPVLEIFTTLKGVMGNAVYLKDLERIEKEVANGIPLSVSIRKSSNFPAMVGQLLKVGEQSGDLAGMLTVLGNFFEKEVDGMARNLSALLEPIIMIIMGVVIGFVLISVLQPIYGLINAV